MPRMPESDLDLDRCISSTESFIIMHSNSNHHAIRLSESCRVDRVAEDRSRLPNHLAKHKKADSMASSQFRTCAVCQKPDSRLCVACKMVAYCGSEHQKADWKTHKSFCKQVQERAAKGNKATEADAPRWLRFTDPSVNVDMKLAVPAADLVNRGAMFAQTTKEESKEALDTIDRSVKGWLALDKEQQADTSGAARFAQDLIILWHFHDERVVEVETPRDPKNPFAK